MTGTVNASPTKRLVAYVLTKDVRLQDAILDLIDNSIDGGRRMGNQDLSGKKVLLTVSKDQFVIQDNCGGIPYDLARDYAFRFGRPDDYAPMDSTADLIGNFGVGMKRALLKMGQTISIESRTASVYFKIDIDVPSWLADDKNWTFEFSEIREEPSKPELTGTSVKVSNLYQGVAEQFAMKSFVFDLKTAIEQKQAIPMLQGFRIFVNDLELDGVELSIGSSKSIAPFRQNLTLVNDHRTSVVALSVIAGVSDQDNDRAGWYVICNGRTILRADTSAITGWGNKLDDDRIPKYHHQYSRFRGYAIFTASNPDDLPWNTAKSGVDVEHPFYRRALQLMLQAMKEVFSFLIAVDKESDADERPLTKELEKLRAVPLDKVSVSPSFKVNVKAAPPTADKKLRVIRYKKPLEKVQAVMEALQTNDIEQVGSLTFDAYYEINCEI